MRRSQVMFIVLLGFAMTSLLVPVQAKPPIVKDGKPQATIVIAEKPARMTRLASLELQRYIEKISGAKLPIATKPDPEMPVTIYLGKSDFVTEKQGNNQDLKDGAYRVATGKNWIAMSGSEWEFEPVEPYAHYGIGAMLPERSAERQRIEDGLEEITGGKYLNPFSKIYPFWDKQLEIWMYDDAGTLNAVYDFLRSLGVRWFAPGDMGEIVPQTKHIVLPDDNQVVRPDFGLRKIAFWVNWKMPPEERLWALRMGVNEGANRIGITQFSHGAKYVHARPEMKEAHPSYYALWGGERAFDHKRGMGAPCLSSQGMFKEHVNYAKGILSHFNEPMISIDVVDGYGGKMCQCPRCQGKDTPERGTFGFMSDYVFDYMNRVATELYETNPQKKVSALAYGYYLLPPEQIEQFPPNLAMVICQHRNRLNNPEAVAKAKTLRNAWLDKLPSKKIYLHEYYIQGQPDGPWDGIPTYFPHLISNDLKSLKGIGSGEEIEVYQGHDRGEHIYDYLAINHLNLYITTRLWWNADQDVDILLDEYYTLYYGPAREQMKAFVEYAEANYVNMRTQPDIINTAQNLLAVARKVAGDSIYGQRIDQVVRYTKPMELLKEKIATPRQGVPEIVVGQTDNKGIKLDGKIDEHAWSNASAFPLVDCVTGNDPQQPTTVKAVWADDALYLAMTCMDSNMKQLKIGTTKNEDANIWYGDVVEVLLETQFNAYYQITVNPAGATIDMNRSPGTGQFQWSSGAQFAVHHAEGFWSVELCLPAAGGEARDMNILQGIAGDKPIESAPWYLNVCRQRIGEQATELSSWSPTMQKKFHVPMKFGKLHVQ